MIKMEWKGYTKALAKAKILSLQKINRKRTKTRQRETERERGE